MKLPSISKIPKYQKFNYTPRYYDPVKEDIEQRTERIKKDLEGNLSLRDRSPLRNAFRRRTMENRKSNITQLLLIILLLGTFCGYIYFGNEVIYLFIFIIPYYILVRKKVWFRKS